MARASKEEDFFHSRGIMRPQGAPRGLLAYYILFSLSRKPSHGYEILHGIESKTEGAWRPGAGSIYPILKKFVKQGYIKSNSVRKSLATAQRVYEITPKGEKYLVEIKDMFSHAGERWGSMRRIFFDFIEPADVLKLLSDGSRTGFQMWQEVFRTKISGLPKSEVEYVLKEYALGLERQLGWATDQLKQFRPQKQVSADRTKV